MSSSSILIPYQRSADHVQSPFRYPGGKYYALKFIVPFLNLPLHTEYREPFIGGGSVFFAKSKSPENWINDLESEVINVYRHIQCKRLHEHLISRVVSETASRDRHRQVKTWAPSSLLDKAHRIFYLNRTSYSGIINKPAWGWEVGLSAPPENWETPLRNAHHKLKDVKISDLDFEEVIKAKSRRAVLIYCDPPYMLADQRRAYTKPFAQEDHLRLMKCLKNTSHLFCLSYDNCNEVKSLYRWAYIYERNWNYNTANTSGQRKVGKELVITNYDAKELRQGQLF